MGNLFKRISYTFISNLISFVISALVTFIVPKMLGVESYGYFQLYHFYINYTGFLHLGWADGVFLRYGGDYYDLLDKRKFSAQFRLYSALEIVFGLVICFGGLFINEGPNKSLVFSLIGISVLLHLPRTLLQYILQCTNRIKEYASLLVLEKTVYFLVIAFSLLLGRTRFVFIIAGDLAGKAIALIYAIYQCRTIVFSRPEPINSALIEAKENIEAGSKLLFSNIASLLIIGFVRIAIERQWDVATFGKVSLTISVSNLLMVFIRAVALVIFPMLCRTDSEKLAGIYKRMRTCLMVPLLGLLILYYPGKAILSSWLPEYADSLKYMALLFPMCVFESKMSMLIETYMKTLRKEKKLLLVNVVTVCLSALLTGITIYGMNNLNLAVACILVLLGFRCVFAEILLSKDIRIGVQKDIVCELVLTMVFVGSSWFIGGITGFILYTISYLLYLVIKRDDVKLFWNMIRNVARKEVINRKVN